MLRGNSDNETLQLRQTLLCLPLALRVGIPLWELRKRTRSESPPLDRLTLVAGFAASRPHSTALLNAARRRSKSRLTVAALIPDLSRPALNVSMASAVMSRTGILSNSGPNCVLMFLTVALPFQPVSLHQPGNSKLPLSF